MHAIAALLLFRNLVIFLHAIHKNQLILAYPCKTQLVQLLPCYRGWNNNTLLRQSFLHPASEMDGVRFFFHMPKLCLISVLLASYQMEQRTLQWQSWYTKGMHHLHIPENSVSSVTQRDLKLTYYQYLQSYRYFPRAIQIRLHVLLILGFAFVYLSFWFPS
jgi:hypothetical protein